MSLSLHSLNGGKDQQPWDVTACSLVDGYLYRGSMFLQDVGDHPTDYTIILQIPVPQERQILNSNFQYLYSTQHVIRPTKITF
jgi:hypothetical protein